MANAIVSAAAYIVKIDMTKMIAFLTLIKVLLQHQKNAETKWC